MTRNDAVSASEALARAECLYRQYPEPMRGRMIAAAVAAPDTTTAPWRRAVDRLRVADRLAQVLAIDETDAREPYRAWITDPSDITGDGERVWRLEVDGRARNERWVAPPSEAARDIRSCGCTVVLGVGPDGAPVAIPWGCGRALCPEDYHRRAVVRARRYAAPLVPAVAARRAALVTLTQPAVVPPREAPALVCKGERAWVRTAPGGDRAVAGESLAAARLRWRETWRRLRNQRGAAREAWKGAAYAYGCEYTGIVPPKRPGAGVLRWHVHGHAVVVPPEGRDPLEWGREVLARWVAWTPGAKADAQDVRVIEGDPFGAAIEALKYPLKPSELTAAQVAEVWCTVRGLRSWAAGGGWYAAPDEPGEVSTLFVGWWAIDGSKEGREARTDRDRVDVLCPADPGYPAAPWDHVDERMARADDRHAARRSRWTPYRAGLRYGPDPIPVLTRRGSGWVTGWTSGERVARWLRGADTLCDEVETRYPPWHDGDVTRSSVTPPEAGGFDGGDDDDEP